MTKGNKGNEKVMTMKQYKSEQSIKEMATAMNVTVPSEFICPRTSDVMMYPLMTRSGLSFERSAIIEWLKYGNSTCPITRTPLVLTDLVPNKALENKIARWMWEYSIPILTPMTTSKPIKNDFVIAIVSPTTTKVETKFYRKMIRKWGAPSIRSMTSTAA